jgi:hypothetical protein
MPVMVEPRDPEEVAQLGDAALDVADEQDVVHELVVARATSTDRHPREERGGPRVRPRAARVDESAMRTE